MVQFINMLMYIQASMTTVMCEIQKFTYTKVSSEQVLPQFPHLQLRLAPDSLCMAAQTSRLGAFAVHTLVDRMLWV